MKRLTSPDDILQTVGKRMPYTYPEGMGKHIEDSVMEAIKNEPKPEIQIAEIVKRTKKPRPLLLRLFAPVAVAAAIAAAVILTLPSVNTPKAAEETAAETEASIAYTEVDRAFDALSESDKEYLIDLCNDEDYLSAAIYEQ